MMAKKIIPTNISRHDVIAFDTRLDLDLYLAGDADDSQYDELSDVTLTTCYDLIRNGKSLILWGENK